MLANGAAVAVQEKQPLLSATNVIIWQDKREVESCTTHAHVFVPMSYPLLCHDLALTSHAPVFFYTLYWKRHVCL